MNKVLDKLPALVAEELEAANAVNPPFHSLHEGWAVLQEEVDETHVEACGLQITMADLWDHVKDDKTFLALLDTAKIYKYALQTAAEAIQVAAMAQKLIDYIEGGNQNA